AAPPAEAQAGAGGAEAQGAEAQGAEAQGAEARGAEAQGEEDEEDEADGPEEERLDPARHVLGVDRFARAEESVAEAVARLPAPAPPWPADRALASEGVLVSVGAALARSGVVALTGAAGGGLDGTVDALVESLRAADVGVLHVRAQTSPLRIGDRVDDVG